VPTALITGASTGIGRATALRLAASGWRVLAGVRELAAGERLAAEAAEAAGTADGDGRRPGSRGTVTPLTLDVTDAAQIAAATELVRERTEAGSPDTTGSLAGGLDALINNAGIALGGPLELVEQEDWRRQFEVNVFGQVAVTRALLPALREARGRIVFVSSVGGRVSVPFNGPYAGSKHALEAIGDALRGELRGMRVAVSLIEPGSVKTPIWGKGRETLEAFTVPPELEEQYGTVPAAFGKVLSDSERRGVAPEQVAAAIEHALTARRPRARYVVGRDARALMLMRTLLPTGAFDRVIRRVLGV